MPLAGLATGRPGGRAFLLRALDARPMRSLGSFSYSLYLTHAPIVAIVCERIVAGRVPEGVPFFLVSLAPVLPLTIGFAWGFSALFETPFRRQRSTSGPARPLPLGQRGAGMSRTCGDGAAWWAPP